MTPSVRTTVALVSGAGRELGAPRTSVTGTSFSVLQFAAQPSPPKVLQWMQRLSGQSPSVLHTRSMLGPASHPPDPVQSDSCTQAVPAFEPPIHVPPSSQSSPASTTPSPHTPQAACP